MAQLENDFDPTKNEAPRFAPIPADDYPMIATESTIKSNKANTGTYIKMKFQVLSGPFQNRTLFKNFNWTTTRTDEDGKKAVQIGKGQFSELCRAVGVLQPRDTAEVHNKMFLGKVIIKPSSDPQYEDNNDIKEFKTSDGKSVRKKGESGPAQPSVAGQPATTSGAPGSRPW
jgi:hypothetical protein